MEKRGYPLYNEVETKFPQANIRHIHSKISSKYQNMPPGLKIPNINNGKNFDQYDIIVEIDSIKYLKDPGWKIVYNEEHLKKKEIQDIIEKGKKTIVAVLGNSNRGKTHILHKLSGVNFESGYQIQTKGLSIKIHEKNLILLDTAGTNAPLLMDNKIANNSRPTQQEIDNIHLCQIITNYILQSFTINQSHVLICVIGMLTVSEQLFLNNIKKFIKNKKRLIVIHNLIKCKTKDEIIKYKNEVLLKMVSCDLIEKVIPGFDDNHNEFFNKYFAEKNDEDILHFIYCNDDNESKEKHDDNVSKEKQMPSALARSENLDYYNKTTLKYIKRCIKVEIVKPTNIINNLIEHIKEISSSVLKNEIKTIKYSNDKNLIQSEETIEPKEILYGPGDDIIFIGKEYEPMYRYYAKDNYFIIEIDLCSEISELNCNHTKDKISKETIFQITGERKIEEIDDDKEIIFNFGSKRETYKRFKLQINLKLEKIGLKRIEKKYEKESKLGILYLKFKKIN